MTPSSIQTQPSNTAAATAFLRALAAHAPAPETKGSDYLAYIFLDEQQQKPLADPALRVWIMQNQLAPGAYEFMLARTLFFDELVLHALQANVAQIVFLGAGYDSRPYRFQEFIRDTHIFEVDAAPTQQRKQTCLEQAGILIPPQVHFAPINFETDALQAALQSAGYRSAQQTLFIWEGVSYYLSQEAVDMLLATIRSIAGHGSSIGFDYAALSPATLQNSDVQEFRQMMRTRHADEPTTFGIPAGQIEAFLSEHGFQVVEHLTAADLNDRYFAEAGSAPTGRVLPLFCFVHAQLKNE